MKTYLFVAGIIAPCERAASADPPDPVLLAPARSMTELRGDALIASNGPAAAAIGLTASGRFAMQPGELFAQTTVVAAGWTSDGEGLTQLGGGSGTSLAARAGARGRIPLGAATLILTLCATDSTGLPHDRREAFASHPDAFDDLLGLEDPYAVAGILAVEGSVGVHVSSGCTFAELELGTAAVAGTATAIAIDDLFGAFGVGGFVTPSTSLVLEYRFVQQPTGSLATGAYLQHFGLALAGVGPGLRFRAGFGAGVVLGLDYTLPIGTTR